MSFSRPFADAAISSRAAAVLSVTALAGVALVVARAILPPRPNPSRAVLLPAARDAYVYLVLAVATRFVVQQHRSRLQILVLLIVVTTVEAARLRPGNGPRRGATWLAGCVAVCLGVVMAKWALEPGALSDALDRLRLEASD